MEVDKIYKGNCYELIKDLPDDFVDLIITDPPYQFNSMRGGGIMKNPHNQQFSKEITENKLDKGVDAELFNEWIRVMKKINIYIWCNKEQIIEYLDFFVKEKKCNYEILIWHKTDPIAFCGTHYLIDKEYCLYFWETGAKVHISFDKGSTVFHETKNVSDKKMYGHPTIKPIHFIENMVVNSSEENDVVLDTFIGSGTTAVACKHTNRRYIGFEINEDYYKIAVDRVNGISKSGQTNLFDTDFDNLKQGSLFDESK